MTYHFQQSSSGASLWGKPGDMLHGEMHQAMHGNDQPAAEH